MHDSPEVASGFLYGLLIAAITSSSPERGIARSPEHVFGSRQKERVCRNAFRRTLFW